MDIRILLRRGTAAAWTSADPTLASGEVALETDTGKIKVGDGTTAWASLVYLAATSTGRVVHRTLASNPKDATPANRPAGTLAEVGYYSGKLYLCTDATAPTWEAMTSS